MARFKPSKHSKFRPRPSHARPQPKNAQRDRALSSLSAAIDDLAMQIGECLLRTRFLMDMFNWRQGSSITGPDGQPMTIQGGTMYDYYIAHREEILAKLYKDNQERQLAHARQTTHPSPAGSSASASVPSTGSGSRTGSPADAAAPFKSLDWTDAAFAPPGAPAVP